MAHLIALANLLRLVNYVIYINNIGKVLRSALASKRSAGSFPTFVESEPAEGPLGTLRGCR